MRFSLFLLLTMTFALQAKSTYGQKTRISLNMTDVTIEDILYEIEAQSEFHFFFHTEAVDLERETSIAVNSKPISRILKMLFKNEDTSFEIDDRKILLNRTPKAPSPAPAPAPKVVQEQQTEITGTVTDSKGVPLPGVNIVEKGTSNGVTADFDGNYSITVSDSDAVLAYSYVGFGDKEITVGEQTVIDVSMQESTSELEEVVVVGYGTSNKGDLIGAVSQVKSKNIEELPITTFEQALSGQVSGVQLRQTGAPGGGPEVLIRGIGSLSASNAPLYVVDGFPIGNQSNPRDNFILSSIAPQDIESINILKDASAKAIYGSRASNGVVIVETKRGKTGKPTITFGVSTGMQSVPDFEKPNLLDAAGLARFQKERLEDDIAAGATLGPNQQALLDRVQNPESFGTGTYWYDEILRQAPQTEYKLSVNGGSENVRYNISANYLNQQGTIIQTDFKRYNFRANVDVDISDNFRFGVNFAPSRSLRTGGRTDAGSGGFDIFNAVGLSWWADPSANPFDENGDLNNVTQGELLPFYTTNPIVLMRARDDIRRTNSLQMGSFLELDLFDGLTFKTFGSYNYIDNRNRAFSPSNLPFPGALSPNPNGTGIASASVNEDTRFNWLFENSLRYTKTFNEAHNLEAFAAFTMEKREREQTNIFATNITDESIELPFSGNVDQDNIANFRGGAPFGENSLVSLIGRLKYSYKERYYATGTFRRDGSSVFGPEVKYGNFPSFALAWRVANEPFFEDLSNVISELKLEGGYGISGNNSGLGNYAWQGGLTGTDYVFGGNQQPGRAIGSLPNRTLTWEDHKETNLGADLGFFDNRLFVNIDYYKIISEDFIFPTPVPITTGFGSIIGNSGKVRNEGVEVELSASNFLKGEFQWEANLNFTRNRNTVEELENDIRLAGPAGNGTFFSITTPGSPIGLYQGLNITGLFTQEELDDPDMPRYPGAREGSLRWVDGDGDGELEFGEDYQIIGNPHPDFTFGMTHNFSYKNFDLNVVVAGSIGQQIYDQRNQFLQNIDGVFNLLEDIENRYRPGDDPRTKTIPTTVGQRNRQAWRAPNSLTVKDADYMWIRNLTLGYNLRGEKVRDIFKNTRIYLSIQNPFLFTEYESGNPEVARADDGPFVRNVNYGQFPISKIYSIGFNTSF
jgi:TonB-linked SusC/RagA family outer membrane protein